jgi:hypothetical protein
VIRSPRSVCRHWLPCMGSLYMSLWRSRAKRNRLFSTRIRSQKLNKADVVLGVVGMRLTEGAARN